jgi:hypothetical protein
MAIELAGLTTREGVIARLDAPAVGKMLAGLSSKDVTNVLIKGELFESHAAFLAQMENFELHGNIFTLDLSVYFPDETQRSVQISGVNGFWNSSAETIISHIRQATRRQYHLPTAIDDQEATTYYIAAQR